MTLVVVMVVLLEACLDLFLELEVTIEGLIEQVLSAGICRWRVVGTGLMTIGHITGKRVCISCRLVT